MLYQSQQGVSGCAQTREITGHYIMIEPEGALLLLAPCILIVRQPRSQHSHVLERVREYHCAFILRVQIRIRLNT